MENSEGRKFTSTTLVAWVALIIVLFIIGSVVFMGDDNSQHPEDYVKQIQAYRQEKDLTFKTGEGSPIENKTLFDGLNYFFPDKNYVVKARFEHVDDSAQMVVMRSDGGSDIYYKFGRAVFELNKREHKVALLKNLSPDARGFLFLPFSDLTAGRDTYAGGRYLDLKMPEDGYITIDFNMAYNPYCVYNYRYSCPLPPKENFIDTEVRAGEKMYRE